MGPPVFFFDSNYGVIQGYGELFRAILRFAEHLQGNHGESVWVIHTKLFVFFFGLPSTFLCSSKQLYHYGSTVFLLSRRKAIFLTHKPTIVK